jgi:hypothetical protein
MRIATRKPVTSIFFMDRFRCFVLQGFGVVSFYPDQVAEVEATNPCRLSREDVNRCVSNEHAGMMPAEQDTRFWMMTAELSILMDSR